MQFTIDDYNSDYNNSYKKKIYIYGAGNMGIWSYKKINILKRHIDEIVFVDTFKATEDNIKIFYDEYKVDLISKEDMLNSIKKQDIIVISIARPLSEEVFDELLTWNELKYHIENNQIIIYDTIMKEKNVENHFIYKYFDHEFKYETQRKIEFTCIINCTKNCNIKTLDSTISSIREQGLNHFCIVYRNDIKDMLPAISEDIRLVLIQHDDLIKTQKELNDIFTGYINQNNCDTKQQEHKYSILLSCGDTLTSNAIPYIKKAIDNNINTEVFLSDRDILFKNEYLSPFYRSTIKNKHILEQTLYDDLVIVKQMVTAIYDNVVIIPQILCHVDYNNIDKSNIKVIPYYLPQFHSFPENDEWWGQDFTEWTNTKKAKPLYKGHYQPREPHDDIGYYNLIKDDDIQNKQANMVTKYGLHGLCYYYYWFAGKELMEQPIYKMMNDNSVDLPFCIMWANENWTRAWHGKDKEILIEQDYSKETLNEFIEYVIPIMKDERYIKVDNDPLLIIYLHQEIPNFKEVIMGWQQKCIDSGLNGLKVCPLHRSNDDLCVYNCDTSVEFAFKHLDIIENDYFDNLIAIKNFNGYMYSYKTITSFINKRMSYSYESEYVYPSCFVGFDNTARKKNNAIIFENVSILDYQKSLLSAIDYTITYNKKDEQFIFLFAWNEWAEAAYLEPDKEYGYTLLEATEEVIKNNSINLNI